MIHYMLLLGYILVTCHKNNIVTLHVTFMLYRRNKTCLLGCFILQLIMIREKKENKTEYMLEYFLPRIEYFINFEIIKYLDTSVRT